MSEPYNVHQNLIDLWIRQAVYFDGNFRVGNDGGSYLLVNKGKARLFKHGHPRRYNRTPETLEKVLHKLVTRYLNFERDGYYYYYARGEWQRFKRPDSE